MNENRTQRTASLLLAALDRSDDIESVAEALNISPSYAKKLFRSTKGIPFSRYVKSRKLALARELMIGTRLSVKQVANRAGFHDVSHFVKDYKTAFGETPTQSRLSIRIESANKNL